MMATSDTTYPASEWKTQKQAPSSSDGSDTPADSRPSLCLKQNGLLMDSVHWISLPQYMSQYENASICIVDSEKYVLGIV